MPDYILTKSITLQQKAAATVPARDAITALQALNQKLEQAQPRHETVPAYDSAASIPVAAG
jgi:hypothetical protein